ncbi:uncharacterized protein LOC144657583 isoform X1 [Oculina patagonica]
MEEDTECIYDEVRQLVAVSPNKAQYDSKESVLFIFNKPLLVNGGPYEVEFRGESHCLKVPAVLLNSCVIQTHAPVYFPPETTIVTVYDKVKTHEPFIARCTFEFFSRNQVLEELLDKATDPEQLLCDSLGASTANIKMFDEIIARKIQEKSPHQFHLLEISQTGQAEVSGQSNTKYPTLIHFGAAHRLPLTVAACLRYCPAARQACALKNKDGMCPKEIAVKHEHYELSEDLQDFQSNEQSYLKNKTQSTELAVNNCNDEENEEEYIMMGPKLALDDSDRQYDNIKTSGAGISKKDITMTPELWKAIFIAEQAVNESWRNSEFGEETAKAFSQLIQKSAREHNTDSSLTYDVPRVTGPALPPKSNRLTNKRHSIHDIPSSAPPLPPRSPRSPRSAQFFFGDLGLSDRRGSDPNIFHRMHQHFDEQPICEETTVTPPESSQAPKLPARQKCPLAPRAIGNLHGYEWMGSDPNLSHRTNNNNYGSCNGARNSLTLPLQHPQAMNGLQRHPNKRFPFQKCHSVDATSMGLSPRLPPRSPGPHNRSGSCGSGVPVQNPVRNRKCTNHPKDSRHDSCLLSFTCVFTTIACLG